MDMFHNEKVSPPNNHRRQHGASLPGWIPFSSGRDEAMKIKCLSVKQPWAGLLVYGIKPVENRPWKRKPQGQLAICASQKTEPQHVFRMVKAKLKKLGIPYPAELCEINGACIGVVDHIGTAWMENEKPFTDVPRGIRSPPSELRTWWDDEQFGWVFNNQKLIEPVPVKGQLGIYSRDINIQLKER